MCLDNTDQYVCFCASKALVAVFLYTGVKVGILYIGLDIRPFMVCV